MKTTARSKFKRRNRATGEFDTISYLEYFSSEYDKKIHFPDQPLIRTRGRSGATIYLVPELCISTNIPAEAKQRLPQVASIKPVQRREKLDNFLQCMIAGNSKMAAALKKFNMQISARMRPVSAEILPSPTLVLPLKGKMTKYKTNGRDWKQLARNDIIYEPTKTDAQLNIYIIHDSNCRDYLKGYYELLRNELIRIKCPVPFGTVNLVNGDSDITHVACLQKVQKKHDKRDFVLVVQGLANPKDAINEMNYQGLKLHCLNNGFISQGLNLTRSAQDKKGDARARDQILNNIARQIANKLGYLSWNMDLAEVIPTHKEKTFLVLGIDVYHAPVEVDKGYTQKRSMAAIHAWLLKGNDTQFFSTAFVHQARSEIHGRDAAAPTAGQAEGLDEKERADAAARTVKLQGESKSDGIGAFVASVVQKAKVSQKDLIVIVYRDGLAESQMAQAKDLEVRQIKQSVPQAQLAFIVVQKATHARFFGSQSADGKSGEFGNVAAGTLIGQDARMTEWENFYLVPCKNSLSTARPVNYVIVERAGTLKLEELTKFTWAMHFLYPNWTDTIKLPAPTQCAHKLALQLGSLPSAAPEIPRELEKTLFFL